VQRLWGVRCISVEANPSLCARWTAGNEVINAAVANRSGDLEFYVHANIESSSLFRQPALGPAALARVPAMTLDEVMEISHSTHVALVKVDIEGAETEVLMGASETALQACGQISVEFHDFSLPEISAEDVERVKSRLHELGFFSVSFSRGNTDVLFINRSGGLTTRLEREWLRHVVRNFRGARRVVRRMLSDRT